MSEGFTEQRSPARVSNADRERQRHETAVGLGYENWEQAIRASAWQPAAKWAARLGISRKLLRTWRKRYGVPLGRNKASWQGPAGPDGSVKSLGPYPDLASLDEAVRNSAHLPAIEASAQTHINTDMITVRRTMLGLSRSGMGGAVAKSLEERDRRVQELGYANWADAVTATGHLPAPEAAEVLGVQTKYVPQARRRVRAMATEGGLNAIAVRHGQPNWGALMKVSSGTPAEALAPDLGVEEIEILNWRGQSLGYRDWKHAVLVTAGLDVTMASSELEVTPERVVLWRRRTRVNSPNLELADEAREIAGLLWDRRWTALAVASTSGVNHTLVSDLMRGDGPIRVKRGTAERLAALKSRKPVTHSASKWRRSSPEPIRKAIMMLIETGMSQHAIAKEADLPYPWVSDVLNQKGKYATSYAQRVAVMKVLARVKGPEAVKALDQRGKHQTVQKAEREAAERAD